MVILLSHGVPPSNNFSSVVTVFNRSCPVSCCKHSGDTDLLLFLIVHLLPLASTHFVTSLITFLWILSLCSLRCCASARNTCLIFVATDIWMFCDSIWIFRIMIDFIIDTFVLQHVCIVYTCIGYILSNWSTSIQSKNHNSCYDILRISINWFKCYILLLKLLTG